MNRNKLIHKQFQLACVTLLLFTNTLQVQAKSQSFIIAQKFPDNGAPRGRQRGGTSRGDCPALKTPLTALVPSDKNHKSILTSTVAEYPTFWVYLPELPTNLRSGEFVLQDERGQDIYRTPLTLPGPGAMAISLPSNPKYALKHNMKYRWFFQVFCGESQNQPESLFVDAWLQRVPLTPELKRQLQLAKSREYSVYAAHQLWYDAVTNLAELRRINPDQPMLSEQWTKLLKTFGLAELAEEPIVKAHNCKAFY